MSGLTSAATFSSSQRDNATIARRAEPRLGHAPGCLPTVMSPIGTAEIHFHGLVGTPRCGVRTAQRAVPTSFVPMGLGFLGILPGIEMPGYCHCVAPRRPSIGITDLFVSLSGKPILYRRFDVFPRAFTCAVQVNRMSVYSIHQTQKIRKILWHRRVHARCISASAGAPGVFNQA